MTKLLKGHHLLHALALMVSRRKQAAEAVQRAREELSRAIDQLEQERTERKRVEEKLLRAAEGWRTTFDSIADLVSNVDKDFKLVRVNKALADAFKVKPKELVGKTCYEVFHGTKEPPPYCPHKKTLETKKPATVEFFEPRLGTHLEVSTSPIFDDKGEVIGSVNIAKDITERKQAEEVLKRSNEFAQIVLNSTNDAVSIIDVHDFRMVGGNDIFLKQLGLKEKEVIGKTCYEITHHRSTPCAPPDGICPLRDTVTTGKYSVSDHTHLRADGKRIDVEVSTSPIKDENGKVIQVVHVTKDVTERKKMEEQLIITDRLASIGELAAGIAHELNNPLTGVIGFSQLLLGKDVSDDVREDVKVIYSEAQRAAEVVKNLLTFARKHPPLKQLVNINSIIQKVLELRAYEQRVSNIQVNTQFATDLPEIIADYFQLQQVFLNIIINAEHFMIEAHNRGTLTITTERAGDIIRASFADDGPGISKEDMGHVFNPFFTTKKVGKGTGLGLSICHGMITEHGGRIYAESELGKGATFVVELPITIDKKER